MAATPSITFPAVYCLSSSFTTTNTLRAYGPTCPSHRSNFFKPNSLHNSTLKPSRLSVSHKIGVVPTHVFRVPIFCCLADDGVKSVPSESPTNSATEDIKPVVTQVNCLIQCLCHYNSVYSEILVPPCEGYMTGLVYGQFPEDLTEMLVLLVASMDGIGEVYIPFIFGGKEATIDLKLPRRSLLLHFTCNSCGERSKKLINRVAYECGTVFVQCAGCLQHHKLIDNLGLVVEYDFREESGMDSNADQVSSENA